MLFKKIPVRALVWLMIFLTSFGNYLIRSDIFVLLSSIVTVQYPPMAVHCSHNRTIDSLDIPLLRSKGDTVYNWTETEQKYVIQAYFYGAIPFSFMAGTIIAPIGPRILIAVCTVLGATVNALVPFLASQSWVYVCIARLIVGVTGGLVYPAHYNLISRWSREDEHGAFMAANVATIFAYIFCWLLKGGIRWATLMYINATMAGVFGIVFAITVTNVPQKHYWMDEEELERIVTGQQELEPTIRKQPPYCRILFSLTFWGLTMGHFGNVWSVTLLQMFIPRFLQDTVSIEKYDLNLSVGMPSLARVVVAVVCCLINDYAVREKLTEKIKLRQYATIFSHLIAAFCLFFLIATKCNSFVIVTLIAFYQGITGALYMGVLMVPLDMAPNYSGSVYGMMESLALTAKFIVPAMVLQMLEGDSSKLTYFDQHLIFMISSLVICMTGIVFIVLVRTDVKEWNKVDTDYFAIYLKFEIKR